MIFEAIIKDQFINHPINKSLIKNTQLGFLSNKSCTTNLLEFFEKVTEMFDNNNRYNIPWFWQSIWKSAKSETDKEIRGTRRLKGRKQRVVLNGKWSDRQEVTSGVPQWSDLGPLAFIVFINDNDSCTNDLLIVALDNLIGWYSIQHS